MNIPYEEAIHTLENMFSAYDRDTLITILEDNNGNMENTIDMLLAMENNMESLNSNDTKETNDLNNSNDTNNSLPSDFLRIPGDTRKELLEQEKCDFMLAQMLQNEFFREQIMQDDELHSVTSAYTTNSNGPRSIQKEKSVSDLAVETLTAISGKIVDMSEVTKKKIHDLYNRYQKREDLINTKDLNSHTPLMRNDDDEHEDDKEFGGSPMKDLHRRIKSSSHVYFPVSSKSPDKYLNNNTEIRKSDYLKKDS